MDTNDTAAPDDLTDAMLVVRSADGDRGAFGVIVGRYQTLVCSLAYSATGDVGRSEDLAQETFVTAWNRLRELREPAKLRSWLCGIARNLINNRRRRLEREPASGAVALDFAADTPAVEPLPSEAAISREHQRILWQALERLPDTYREPLILFYREQRSVERVARDLGLGDDAVRQRLSRGRKLLHEQVVAFVEGALAQSAPGPTFTFSVIGALPLFAMPALATAAMAGAGGAAAKTGGAAVAAKFLAAVNVVVGPLLGILAAWIGVRSSLADTRTLRERTLVKRYFLTVAAGTVLFTLASIPLNLLAKAHGGLNPAVMVLWLALLLADVAGMSILALRLQRQQQRLRREECEPPAASLAPGAATLRMPREYRSRWTLLGLPLVHVRLHPRRDEAMRPAVGWIAIGNYAFGVLFAWGGVAVGAVSGGGLSAGLVSIGAVSVGVWAVGGLAIGAYALGGVAVGLIATGAFSFGWIAAEGRYAVAREFALGVHASARHVNDVAAQLFFRDRPWLDLRSAAGKAMLGLVWLPSLLIVIGHLARARRLKPARPLRLPPAA